MKCKCGSNMVKQDDRGDNIHRYDCPVCGNYKAVSNKSGKNERTRMQFGLGLKQKRWI